MDRRSATDQSVSERSGAGAPSRSIALYLIRIAATFAAILFVRPASAAPPTPAEDFWTFPDSSLAYFAFDPSSLGAGVDKDPARALIEAGLRSLLDNIATVDGGGSPIPSAMLAPGVLGASPYRLCLFDLATTPREGPASPDRPLRMEHLCAILEIRAPAARHDELIGVLRGALDRGPASEQAGAGTESPLALPENRKGTKFIRAGESEWREVSWCATTTGLLIGNGHGALERWLSAPPVRAGAVPEWYAHRSNVAQRRGSSNPILEAMIDTSALRRAAPDEFAHGRMGRLAEAWHIRNARELMLHIRVPRPAPVEPGDPAMPATAAPLLLVDISFSSRADPPPTCISIPISEGAWPAQVSLIPPTTPYALVFAADWQRWINLSLDTWAACSPRAGVEPNAARGRWMRAHTTALERLTGRAGPWVVLGGRGALALTAPFRPTTGPDRLDADLREVCSSISNNIRFDPVQRVWSLRLPAEQADPDKILSQFSWTVRKDIAALRAAWNAGDLAFPAK